MYAPISFSVTSHKNLDSVIGISTRLDQKYRKQKSNRALTHCPNRTATMSEVQVNAVLSTQSTESTTSISTTNSNGEPVMSKSKARSLRRKRAKQRKMAALQNQQQPQQQTVEKAQSQETNKENQAQPLPQQSQAMKKKRKPRKRKKKTKPAATEPAAAVPVEEVVDNNATSTETPKDISNGTSNGVSMTAEKEIEKPQPESSSQPEATISVRTEPVVEVVEDLAKPDVVERSFVVPPAVTSPKPDPPPCSFYEDDNEDKKANDDCECACVIS